MITGHLLNPEILIVNTFSYLYIYDQKFTVKAWGKFDCISNRHPVP